MYKNKAQLNAIARAYTEKGHRQIESELLKIYRTLTEAQQDAAEHGYKTIYTFYRHFIKTGKGGQTMNTYQRRKEQARQKAIAWQNDFGSKAHTGWDLVDAYAYFSKLGKRYGLTREFTENGII